MDSNGIHVAIAGATGAVGQEFLAILGEVKVTRDPRLGKGLLHQETIVGVVIRQEDHG